MRTAIAAVSHPNARKLLEYLAVSANSDVVINHNCHHPEIDLTGPASAEGLWYLQDWYYNKVQNRTVRGAAFYRDRYQKQDGKWKIRHTGYERVWEVVEDNVPPITFTANVRLGLRYHSEELAHILTDKAAQRDALARFGIPAGLRRHSGRVRRAGRS